MIHSARAVQDTCHMAATQHSRLLCVLATRVLPVLAAMDRQTAGLFGTPYCNVLQRETKGGCKGRQTYTRAGPLPPPSCWLPPSLLPPFASSFSRTLFSPSLPRESSTFSPRSLPLSLLCLAAHLVPLWPIIFLASKKCNHSRKEGTHIRACKSADMVQP